MASYGYYLEVAGWDWLPATHSSAPDTYSRSDTRAVLKTSGTWAQELSADPFTGESETGGIGLELVDVAGTIAAELQFNASSPRTRLTQDHTRAVATLTVADTTDFGATGTVWIGQEAITYTGKTGTTFTGCGRGALQTVAEAHNQYSAADGGRWPEVTGFCPSWNGRRCWLYRYEIPFVAPAVQDLVAAGEIEGVEWARSGDGERVLPIKIVSAWAKIKERTVLSPPFAKGHLNSHLTSGADWCNVLLDDPDTPFPDGSSDGALYYSGRRWAVIANSLGDELISYDSVTHPFAQTTVTGVCSGTTLDVGDTSNMVIGDVLDIATSSTQRQAVSEIVSATRVRLADALNPSTAGAEAVTIVSRCTLDGIRRFQRGTTGPKTELINSEIREVRLLEGTLADILLRCLLSRDGDASNNTQYDTLPEGWGLALDDTKEVDVTAFQSLLLRDMRRRYLVHEPISTGDLVKWLALSTASAIYADRDGKVTAVMYRQRYPGEYTISVDSSVTQSDSPPRGVPARIVNQMVWSADRPLLKQDSEPDRWLKAQQPDSAHRHGWRALAELEDPGIIGGQDSIVSVADIYFGRWSEPSWVVTLDVPYPVGLTFTLGDRCSLTASFIPDLEGAVGVTSEPMFVTRVSPNDGENTCTLTLQTNRQDRTCLIAPAGVIASSTPGTPGSIVLNAATDMGDQADINYWQTDDLVRLIDRSTLGGAVTVVTATVTGVTVGTNTLNLSTVPAWAAAGDLVEPDDYAAYNGTANAADWRGIYGAWADNTGLDLDGDAPYKWGT